SMDTLANSWTTSALRLPERLSNRGAESLGAIRRATHDVDQCALAADDLRWQTSNVAHRILQCRARDGDRTDAAVLNAHVDPDVAASTRALAAVRPILVAGGNRRDRWTRRRPRHYHWRRHARPPTRWHWCPWRRPPGRTVL